MMLKKVFATSLITFLILFQSFETVSADVIASGSFITGQIMQFIQDMASDSKQNQEVENQNTDLNQDADPSQDTDPNQDADPNQGTDPSQDTDPNQSTDPSQDTDPSQGTDPNQIGEEQPPAPDENDGVSESHNSDTEPSIYSDIEGHWSEQYIKESIMKGYDDNTFRPNNLITVNESYIEIARVISAFSPKWQNAGELSSADAFLLLVRLKVIEPEDISNLNRPITREEIAKLTIRAFGYEQQSTRADFADYNLISVDKRGYVNTLNQLGIVNGIDNKFFPLSDLTRAEFCSIVTRLLKITDPNQIDLYKYSTIVPESRAEQVPVLLYHSMTTDSALAAEDTMYVSQEKFIRDIELICALGYTPIFAKDLERQLPKKPIIISFDDGYLDNYELVYPLAKQRNIKITIFTNGYTSELEGFEHKINWHQAKEMVDSQVIDIQSHTDELHSLNGQMDLIMQKEGETEQEYYARILDDVNNFNRKYQSAIGYYPVALAYPYGYHNEILESIINTYYKYTFTSEVRIANISESFYLLPRISVIETTELDKILSDSNGVAAPDDVSKIEDEDTEQPEAEKHIEIED